MAFNPTINDSFGHPFLPTRSAQRGAGASSRNNDPARLVRFPPSDQIIRGENPFRLPSESDDDDIIFWKTKNKIFIFKIGILMQKIVCTKYPFVFHISKGQIRAL